MDHQPKLTVRMRKITRKKVFTEFVASTKLRVEDGSPQGWKCCNHMFTDSLEIYKHISCKHSKEVENKVQSILQRDSQIGRGKKNSQASEPEATKEGLCESERDVTEHDSRVECEHSQRCEQSHCSLLGGDGVRRRSYTADDVYPWLPATASADVVNEEAESTEQGGKGGQVLLFYKYMILEDPDDICAWQRELCRRLQLHGKVRIAREGLNGTVGGSLLSTQQYIQAVLAHPCFSSMSIQDFKTSEGGRESFPEGLVVSVHQEIVPMGINPSQVSFEDAGSHLNPAQFHEEVERYQTAKESGQETDRILIDCRNFYESKIGTFTDAIKPDIRKFSYWPEYVDKNRQLFADKTVLMYCTGGIRCERGSAYLKSKGVCKDVLQLEGGIHRYLEEFPDGFFRGKLFVFDNRFSIQSNKDVLAECVHCSKPWDQYQPCTSPHCYQLVLSCPACRESGLTTCCIRCRELADGDVASLQGGRLKKRKEECSCTMSRERIPTEKVYSS